MLGVSTDTVASHKDFAAKLKLPFFLLADDHQVMARAYGVLKSLEMGGERFEYAQRSLFLIGRDGRLLFIDPDFKLTKSEWTALFGAVKKLKPHIIGGSGCSASPPISSTPKPAEPLCLMR